jgi:putative transposase
MRKRYSSDLSDAEWAIIEGFFDAAQKDRGRGPPEDLREIMNAIFYVSKNGCIWRDLPGEFPFWKRVYNYYSRLKLSGKLERLMHCLHAQVRQKQGRAASPSLAIIDSQSVKSCSQKKSGQGN